ncbi:putative pentatricopeptide repeat-containing protein [Quercus suber]|uniref:Pentatricopeptide repeat-containing protein n=1 Tax=Quercus suber TaxID=58331 RepID=A0AAW0KPN8_QUESU
MEILCDMRIEGISLDLEMLSIVLDNFIRAHQVSNEIQMFGNVEEFGLKCYTECLNVLLQCASNNCDPDVITYTKLFAASFKAHKVADALELLFDEMLSCGLIPCIGTITSFLEP